MSAQTINSAARSDDDVAALLLQLETMLMQPQFRKDSERASDLLAPEFREFGSSGREWSRETILDLLTEEAGYVPPSIENFTVSVLSPEAALVTYRAARPHLATLRSSIWVLRDGQWRVIFHQGTLQAQC